MDSYKSPLFLIVIDPLIKKLEALGLGSRLTTKDGKTHWLGALCFADDIAICADSPEELQQMLDVLSDFRYQLLSTEVELKKTGTLLLGLSLAGNNPERFEGREINFNINN